MQFELSNTVGSVAWSELGGAEDSAIALSACAHPVRTLPMLSAVAFVLPAAPVWRVSAAPYPLPPAPVSDRASLH
jgi:hypothetical protein